MIETNYAHVYQNAINRNSMMKICRKDMKTINKCHGSDLLVIEYDIVGVKVINSIEILNKYYISNQLKMIFF